MSYDVIITREGSDWLADVPSVPGAHTFARSLAGLIDSVREVIILMDDLPDSASVDMRFRYDVKDENVSRARDVASRRAQLAGLEADMQADTLIAVQCLTTAGYSVRDTAALVGITPGRVSQLTKQ